MPTWTFEQIEGTDRKKLELDAYNAPFGRPRQGAVISEEITSRVQTTHYPGGRIPTRHAFGTNYESTELHGRWMTKTQTDGKTANDVAAEWSDFIKDERTCRIAWGFIVSYVGYVRKLKLQRESEHEIAWTMTLDLDYRDDDSPPKDSKRKTQVQPLEIIDDIQSFLASSKKLQDNVSDAFSTDFLDAIDNIAAALNTPAAELNKLVGKFSDLQKASINTLYHFRAAIVDIKTAVIGMRDLMVDATIDDVMLVRTAESDVAWVKWQANFDNQTYLILDQLNQLDRQAELAQQNDPTKFVTAKNGDTWEAISIRASGGTDKVAAIRQINGIKYGDPPVPGESYLVP